MYGIFHILSVSVGLDGQICYLFTYITGYLNVRKISETMDFWTFVGPLINRNLSIWVEIFDEETAFKIIYESEKSFQMNQSN